MTTWTKPITLFCLLFAMGGQATEMSEYKLKALFVYNFVRFVQWPEDAFANAESPVTICVLGTSSLEQELAQTIEAKSGDGRKHGLARPRAMRRIQDASQAAGCHILFVSASQPKRASTVLGELKVNGLLTVGEVNGFAADGGVINFKLKDGNVRLEINVTAAQREGLQISSKLLSLAEIVK